jgi:antitoxin PrlF
MQVIEEVCTITAKGQTTVPKAVRQALGVGYGGRIAFRVAGNSVTIHALSDEAEQDPALSPFLSLLVTDLTTRPGKAVRPLTSDVTSHVAALAEEIGEVDLDAPIEGDVSL